MRILVFSAIALALVSALQLSESAQAATTCAGLLYPDANAKAVTTSFITLLNRLSEKLGTATPEMLSAIGKSAEAINPTVGIRSGGGLSEADVLAFRMAFAKIMCQGDIDWVAVKRAAEIIGGRRSEVERETEKAKIETAFIWTGADQPLPKTILQGSDIVRFESSKGVQYLVGAKTTPYAKGRTTVVNLATLKSFSFTREEFDRSLPVVVELANGEVQVVFTENGDIVRYSADTGEFRGHISMAKQSSYARYVGSPWIKELIAYRVTPGSLHFIAVWDRYYTAPACISRIDAQTGTAEFLTLGPEPRRFYLSPNGSAVYSVAVAATAESGSSQYTITAEDLTSNRQLVASESFLSANDKNLPFLTFATATKKPFVAMQVGENATVLDLSNGRKRTFQLPSADSRIENMYDENSKIFVLLQPVLDPAHGVDFWKMEYGSSQAEHIIKISEMTSTPGATYLIQSKRHGPLLLWTNGESGNYVLELTTGKSRILTYSSKSFYSHIQSTYETPDGRLEIVRKDDGSTAIKQLFGPILDPNGEDTK